MRRLLQLTTIAAIAVLAIGVNSAQSVGSTTPTMGDGTPPDAPDCTPPDCTDDMGGAGTSGGHMFECLANQGAGQGTNVDMADWGWCEEDGFNGTSDYWGSWYEPAVPGTNYTLVIGRNDGEDLEGICSWDNIDGIQGWTLHLGTPDLIAKFKKFEAPTTGGNVYFKFDSTVVNVYYFRFFSYTKESFNQLLIDKIEQAGLHVEESDNYIRVSHIFSPTGISAFTMRIPDYSEFKSLDVALEANNEIDELLCRYVEE